MNKTGEKKKITAFLRNQLLLLFTLMFLLTMLVVGVVERQVTKAAAHKQLALHISDVKQDISDASDYNILTLAEFAAFDYESLIDIAKTSDMKEIYTIHGIEYDEKSPETTLLNYLKYTYELTEISIVNNKGIITASTVPDYIGFDMASGEQSAEFLCLLGDQRTFAQEYQPISFDNEVSRKYAGCKLKRGGFLQVAYDSEKFREDVDSVIYRATKNRHIGETGYIMIITEEGDIISTPNEMLLGKNVTDLGIPISMLEEKMTGEPLEGQANGEGYYGLGEKAEGYYIFAMLPIEEAMSTLKKAVGITNVLEILAFAATFALVFLQIKTLVVKNIDKIDESLDKIAKGDLDVTVDVRQTREFDSLSDNINTTVDALKESARKEIERINADMEYAKNIQRSALPMLFPPFPDRTDFEIYATMDPAKEVGGDFYDFELVSSNQLGFCVADVSGKGIPAALFMMRAKTLIKSYGIAGLPVDEILQKVNNDLSENNDAQMFVTCWLGVLNTDTGVIEYANAGHNPPLVRHKDGSFEYLKANKPGFVLGGMEGMKYKKYSVDLDPGDEIFLYTDGVTEATDMSNELYGEQRLQECLDSITESCCQDKCLELRKSIDAFVGEAPQFDDITMLSLKYAGDPDSLTVEATMENYDAIMEFVEERLNAMGCDFADVARINVAADELVSNVIKYAYGDATGLLTVNIGSVDEPRGASVTFIDRGIPFNPLEAKEPDLTLSADDREIGKLGIHMVKKMMDKVEYEYLNGNRVTLTKYFGK